MAADADVVRRMTNEVFLAGNLDALDELLADDLVDHDPPPGLPGTRDGWKQLAGMVVSAFSDRKMEFDDYDTTSDGCVVESWAMTGTHSGEAFGLPPSGQEVRVRGMELFRVDGGKVVEHWGVIDMGDVFMKAGPPAA